MSIFQKRYVRAILALFVSAVLVIVFSHPGSIKESIIRNHKVTCGAITWKNLGGREFYVKCEFTFGGVTYESYFKCTPKTHKGYLHGFDYAWIVYDSTEPSLNNLLETPDDFYDYKINQADTSGILCNTVNSLLNN